MATNTSLTLKGRVLIHPDLSWPASAPDGHDVGTAAVTEGETLQGHRGHMLDVRQPGSARRRRSSAMRSASAGPAECGTQRLPNMVLSTWQCVSMRPGSSRRPGTSTTSAAGSARRSGPIRSMTPSRIRTSAGHRGATGARRATTDQAWTLPFRWNIPAADPRVGRCAPGSVRAARDRRQRDSDPRYRSPASGQRKARTPFGPQVAQPGPRSQWASDAA